MDDAIPARLDKAATAKAGRRFGLTVGLAFLVLAGVARWRGHPVTWMVLGTLGIVALISALLVPSRLGPVERAWMALALLISKVTTPIFMGVVYYLVLTPIGVVRRRMSSSGLQHRVGADGYWADRRGTPRSTLTRQF
jgi:hypothetical protein